MAHTDTEDTTHPSCSGCDHIGSCIKRATEKGRIQLQEVRVASGGKKFTCNTLVQLITARPELPKREVRRIYGESGVHY